MSEMTDPELAQVTAAVLALADEWRRQAVPGEWSSALHPRRAADAICAALLPSAGTDALDRERARASAQALRAAADTWQRNLEEGRGAIAGVVNTPRWLRDRAAAVSPEGGDA